MKPYKKMSVLYLSALIAFMCITNTCKANAAEYAGFERNDICNYSLVSEKDGTFYLSKTKAISVEEADCCNEVVCITTIDKESYDAWKSALESKTAINQSLIGSAYDTSGWVLMYSKLYYRKEIVGTITYALVSKADFKYDRGQPTIVFNSVKSTIACTDFDHRTQIKHDNTIRSNNTLYTISQPGNWVRVHTGSIGAMVASYLEMSFTRGGSTWTSKLANEYVNNQ